MELIKEADVLIAGERILKQFSGLKKDTFIIKNNLEQMADFIREQSLTRKVAVLASGDPGMYGILNFLRKHFTQNELLVIPGISSMQLACAKLCISWHDALLTSTHGRGVEKVVEQIRNHSKVILLTGPEATPAHIARVLIEAGIKDKKAAFCGNLSYPEEVIFRGTLEEVAQQDLISNSVMVISDDEI